MELTPPRRLREHQGPDAEGWLAGLPELAAELIERWELSPERVLVPGGRHSMAVLVHAPEGGRAVLKISAPDHPAALEEAALRRWRGLGAVRVLRCAPESGALLLERLHHETSLRALPEDKATLEALSVVRRLWVDPGAGHPFPTVAEHTARQAERGRKAAAQAGPEVAGLLDEALAVRDSLVSGEQEESVLLHGDFRQGAVLASDADRAPWLAVGPEPLVGERAFDLARLVRDRLHDLVASPGAAAITRRRVARLAEAVEVPAGRLRAWALYRAVLSGVFSLVAGRRTEGEMLLEFATWL